MKEMKAAVIKSTNDVKIKKTNVPELKPGYALIKVAYCGFCGPTEMAIINGLHPRAKFPLVLGHEIAGTVEKIDNITENKEKNIKPGDKVAINPLVYCNECYVCKSGNQHICEDLKLIGIDINGGFEEYCLVPEKNLVKLPDNIKMDVAALSEPMAVGIHAVKESGFQLGDTALVYGAGPIGLMVAEACNVSGAEEIVVVDINEKRLKLAEDLGYSISKDPLSYMKQKAIKFDYIYETTGAKEVLPTVVECVKVKGYIGIVGKFDFPVPLNLHDILFKEINLEGIRVYRENDFIQASSIIYRNQERYKRFVSDYFSIDMINKAITTFKERNNLSRIMISFNKD